MRIPKDEIETYFYYGVDIKNRCIFLTGDIDDDSVSHVIKGMYLMEHINDKEPIELRIMSCGGDVEAMFGLHDVTKTLKSPIHTMGVGKVMSCALLLVACGEKGNRWAGANTSFMGHSISADWGDKTVPEMVDDIKYTKLLSKNMYSLLDKYSGQKPGFWQKKCEVKNKDFYFTADQALEWGIIDAIWEEK